MVVSDPMPMFIVHSSGAHSVYKKNPKKLNFPGLP